MLGGKNKLYFISKNNKTYRDSNKTVLLKNTCYTYCYHTVIILAILKLLFSYFVAGPVLFLVADSNYQEIITGCKHLLTYHVPKI